jgi:hypothetical protein
VVPRLPPATVSDLVAKTQQQAQDDGVEHTGGASPGEQADIPLPADEIGNQAINGHDDEQEGKPLTDVRKGKRCCEMPGAHGLFCPRSRQPLPELERADGE